ncbi:hypothetical protein [Enterococcus gallinarum]
MSKVLKWLEEESDRLTEECHSNSDPYKTVNNSFLEGFNYALANVQGLEQPQLNENQQQVLGWLKDYYKENRPFTTAFGAIRNVASKRWAFIKQNLTEDQQEHVLEVFSRWVQEQEEE